ncbi:D-glycerate dehydrogenase [Rhodanobacter sp. FW510-R12]|uniref:2-hydroxyacid dehydrogenase n=1 Tax=unclassified Rhodanobacter TaxID=2621553 RepID=UPI0007A9A5BA|nr:MULTISPECIES: D-glycerate dehydrogenase [unclassified Rhodanobacter]KZC18445.1 D-glycerate dehydrogenase [Rhodanobacter sp. FW104-R8]KZC28932.1 D-glycerate dehydrogenase [Rhodanobacter sp. FW510-T8]KZC29799.1 D-glycerate dehydrogenase [Rhodanobacter sp. FW510-R10]
MSDKPSVWISRPTFPGVIARLEPHFEVTAEAEERKFSPAELAAKLAGQDAAIVGLKDCVGAAEIARATRLRIVANLGVGYDNLDLDALSGAGIAASNTADVLNESVADYAWALLLGAARRMTAAERWLRAGHWQANGFTQWLGSDVRGRTLGILGMGRIGQAIARRAAGFDMPVLYHNRSPLPAETERACRARFVDKAQLLRESDFLMLVLPLAAQTRHAIGAAELAAMKPTAMLVNVARGGIVDDKALAAALRERRLAGAALDVFEGEPALYPGLLELDNVVLSPHIASASTETRRAMTALAVDNVLAMFGHGPHAGRPPTILNPSVLGK